MIDWEQLAEDLDPSEKCPDCGGQMWRDGEGDWNHVLYVDGKPVALSMHCEPMKIIYVDTSTGTWGNLEDLRALPGRWANKDEFRVGSDEQRRRIAEMHGRPVRSGGF